MEDLQLIKEFFRNKNSYLREGNPKVQLFLSRKYGGHKFSFSDINRAKKEVKKSEGEWDNSAITSALATTGVLVADDATVIGVADDVLIPFVVVGGVAVYLYDNKELIAKQAAEIDRILTKKLTNQLK